MAFQVVIPCSDVMETIFIAMKASDLTVLMEF